MRNSSYISLIIILLLGFFATSCGKEDTVSITLSGILEMGIYAHGDPFVAIFNSSDVNYIQSNPAGAVVAIRPANPVPLSANSYTFDFDLSESGLRPGDKIIVVAYADCDYQRSQLPVPTPGDYVGLFIDPDARTPEYILAVGHNDGIVIKVNREQMDFDFTVTGTIEDAEPGELTVIAYAGDINFKEFNIKDINPDGVVGYSTQEITGTPAPYEMKMLFHFAKDSELTSTNSEIFHYPVNGAFANVYIFAYIDKNGNAEPDNGDIIYSIADYNIDAKVYVPVMAPGGIGAGSSNNFTLNKVKVVGDISTGGTDTGLSVAGSISMASEDYTEYNSPLGKSIYVIAARTRDPMELMDRGGEIVVGLDELTFGDTTYYIDLEVADVSVGDDIVLLALWDRDGDGGEFPSITVGDMVGMYFDQAGLLPYFTLSGGLNFGVNINLDRAVFDHDVMVSGTIERRKDDVDEIYSGDFYLMATTEVFETLTVKSIDTDKVIAYQKIDLDLSAATVTMDYSMTVMNYLSDKSFAFPIENTYIFGFLDRNMNGKPDAGDTLFGHMDSDGAPNPITVNNPGLNGPFSVLPLADLSASSGYTLSVSGSFEIPAGFPEGDNDWIFIAVVDGQNPEALIDDPAGSGALKQFVKVPQAQNTFELELSDTGLAPGDEVMVVALRDRNYTGGYPMPDAAPYTDPGNGDIVGYYFDTEKLTPGITLVEGDNSGVTLKIDKHIYNYEKVIKGIIKGPETGKVIIMGYCGEMKSLDLQSWFDPSKLVIFKKFTKVSGDQPYYTDPDPGEEGEEGESLVSVMPVTLENQNLWQNNLEKVLFFALLDKNGNDIPDAGDIIYVYKEDDKPRAIDISQMSGAAREEVTGIDLEYMFTLSRIEPSGYTVSIQGSFAAPAGYPDGNPVYILVAKMDEDPLAGDIYSSLRNFQQVTAGQNTFNMDLSNTDLVPGDRVTCIALWDKDYNGRFPFIDDGDKLGVTQDRTKLAVAFELQEGVNTVPPEGYEFKINKKYYNHQSKVRFRLSMNNGPSDLPFTASDYSPGDRVLIFLVHEDGITIDYATRYISPIDMDYVVGMANIEIDFDTYHYCNVSTLIYENITTYPNGIGVNPFIGTIDNQLILFAVLDNAPHNYKVDRGERAGYYRNLSLIYGHSTPNLFDANDGATLLPVDVIFKLEMQ